MTEAGLAKAMRQMRGLRRAILSYWYATLEDKTAALIEATSACLVVNILDESVFEPEFGEPYKKLRERSPGGRVVTGLELVRNCETHSPVTFDDLLVQNRAYSVPMNAGAQVMRAVWHWADYANLPTDYVGLCGPDSSEFQKRARKEAQHGYRDSVAGRSVVETLFDAERFFLSLEPRLAVALRPALRYSFAEVQEDALTVLHRPLEGFVGAVPLPDLSNHWDERTTALAPPADRYVENLVKRKNKDVPAGEKRFVTHKIVSGQGVVGYSGDVETATGEHMAWVERSAQIARDIRAGYQYVVALGDDEILVAASDNLVLSAFIGGRDMLMELDGAPDSRGLDRLHAVEAYPDLYVSMRRGF
ncbi:hypothetical protein [Gordonia sp. AC31]|uniref:hypothetical protein n=1 Tax=Gordonia sp. AC31 TaxID=2962571 RepID=UPI00288260E8|nr:hypothetical protein [Gordonia sp. AC31]MDT0224133.1 hypothetical protein [Gordonia sp. AC31]